ncbi:hypothetical protein [Kribbella deserti]|uniref:DNA-binding protein n=1 Tax=Kribbella deserti TaxID=1926257 RepID=A0ABV6QNE8_9ACTN
MIDIADCRAQDRKAARRPDRQPQWIAPSVAVYTTGRPEATIRDWIRRGLLASACDMRSKRLVVNAFDVLELAEAMPARPSTRSRAARRLDMVA